MNTLLVFWLIFILSDNIFISLVSALLFGVHPLHVESVAWVTERKDVLSTFFFLQVVIYYLFYKVKSQLVYYYLSLFVFILALLSKPMVITLPFVLLICDYLTQKSFDRKTVLEKVPFFVISVIFGVVSLSLHQSAGAIASTRLFSPIVNLLIACKGVIFYLAKILLPINLSAIYPYPETINIQSPEYFLPPLLVLALAVAIFYSRRWTKKIIFASLLFFVTVLPVLKLIPIGDAFAADRYMYIPSIGLFYIVGVALYNMYMWKNSFKKARKVSVILFLSIVISILSVLTYQRSNVWQDGETLWLNVLENYPDVPIAHSNLGNIYADKGLLGAAVNEYREALRFNPRLFEARYNLGVTYHEMGFIDNAIVAYRKALRLNPSRTEVRNNLGTVLGQKGKYFEAISEFKKVLRIDPNNTKAGYNLIIVYINLGDCKKAKGLASSFLRLEPEKRIAQVLSERCG